MILVCVLLRAAVKTGCPAWPERRRQGSRRDRKVKTFALGFGPKRSSWRATMHTLHAQCHCGNIVIAFTTTFKPHNAGEAGS